MPVLTSRLYKEPAHWQLIDRPQFHSQPDRMTGFQIGHDVTVFTSLRQVGTQSVRISVRVNHKRHLNGRIR
ncbi:MAG: hypothetical protein ACLFVQ_09755 [Chitinispirillaceae bacterium]